LPFKILYGLSDFLYLIIYYLIGYRKEVVRNNLKLAYPKASNEELLSLEKRFYHHFVDVFLEMAKSFTVSENKLKKRFVYENIELIERLKKEGKSIALMASHYANWEWMSLIGNLVSIPVIGAYTKVSNPYFNEKLIDSRTRFGCLVTESKKFIPMVIANFKKKEQASYILISDQSPTKGKIHHFETFLGQNVPVHTGGDILARKFDLAVVFVDVQKTGRGHYKAKLELMTENPNELKDFEITKQYTRLTERQIERDPAFYFWSHKRFKHKDKIHLLRKDEKVK
jgi:KDO2-lipid IV(A) lauroyltransferase